MRPQVWQLDIFSLGGEHLNLEVSISILRGAGIILEGSRNFVGGENYQEHLLQTELSRRKLDNCSIWGELYPEIMKALAKVVWDL